MCQFLHSCETKANPWCLKLAFICHTECLEQILKLDLLYATTIVYNFCDQKSKRVCLLVNVESLLSAFYLIFLRLQGVVFSSQEFNGVVADSDFNTAPLLRELECILYQMEQNLGVDNPVSAGFFWYLVCDLKINHDLLILRLHVIGLQKLTDELDHSTS